MNESPFFDAANFADCVEIDDFFIRHFNLVPIDEFAELEDDEPAFEASAIDQDLDQYEFNYSVSDINNAKFDAETNSWIIGSNTIKFYTLTPVS